MKFRKAQNYLCDVSEIFVSVSGIVVSICTAVEYDLRLQGVICIDESYKQVLATLNYYQQGQISYPFLLDTTTKIIQHPKIAIATEVTNHPNFTYLQTIETGDNVDTMITTILK